MARASRYGVKESDSVLLFCFVWLHKAKIEIVENTVTAPIPIPDPARSRAEHSLFYMFDSLTHVPHERDVIPFE